jgi:predicted GH43/DUF377 family glycosyl hydrolase
LTWAKQGLIYAPTASLWWAKSHTHVPTACLMDDVIRIYYTSLDENNYGRISYVDLDKDNPRKIQHIATEPVLDLGEPGCFDDCGVVPSCVVYHNNAFHLYYIGFQRTERVPYMLFTGLATSQDGLHFERFSRTPILDRTDAEPYSRSAPHILIEGDSWRMWYWSCLRWQQTEAGIYYQNVIRYAESRDGINWQTSQHICIEPNFPDEYAAGRPWVVHSGNGYKMWYSIRSHSKGYHFGYAESADGLHWQRLDEQAGLSVSESGWDSEMVCYPSIVAVDDELLLFYNGNGHGRSGFGYAIWKDEP